MDLEVPATNENKLEFLNFTEVAINLLVATEILGAKKLTEEDWRKYCNYEMEIEELSCYLDEQGVVHIAYPGKEEVITLSPLHKVVENEE